VILINNVLGLYKLLMMLPLLKSLLWDSLWCYFIKNFVSDVTFCCSNNIYFNYSHAKKV